MPNVSRMHWFWPQVHRNANIDYIVSPAVNFAAAWQKGVVGLFSCPNTRWFLYFLLWCCMMLWQYVNSHCLILVGSKRFECRFCPRCSITTAIFLGVLYPSLKVMRKPRHMTRSSGSKNFLETARDVRRKPDVGSMRSWNPEIQIWDIQSWRLVARTHSSCLCYSWSFVDAASKDSTRIVTVLASDTATVLYNDFVERAVKQ